MRILVAPAHYLFSPHSFSELKWSYEFVKALSILENVSGDVITGYSDIRSMGAFEVHPVLRQMPSDLTFFHKLLFPFQVYRKAKALMSKRNVYDVIWHLLPFGINQTFNLIFLLHKSLSTRFVIGPIQTPQHYSGSDEHMLHWYETTPEKRRSLLELLEPAALNLGQRAVEPLSNRTLRCADVVLAATEDAGQRLRSIVQVPTVTVLPYGITATDFPIVQAPKRPWVTLITIGALVYRKRVDLILEALAKLLAAGCNVRLDVLGDGPQRPQLEEMARILNIEQHVAFHGRVPHTSVPELLASADVLVSASVSESFGNALLEGMCMGKALVSATNPGSRSLLEDGVTGLLVPTGDALALADAVRRLIESGSLRTKLGRQAAAVARETYDWAVIASRFTHFVNSKLTTS